MSQLMYVYGELNQQLMNWELQLTAVYLWVCDCFDKGAGLYAQRHQKNAKSLILEFTDEEAMAVYLYGLKRKYKTAKEIHQYAQDHLLDWFPHLPSYQKFNERLNFLNTAFYALCCYAMNSLDLPAWLLKEQDIIDAVIDSMPIMLAKGSRADQAKVATEVANKGKCASKNIWYHGVKLHCLGFCRPQTIPLPAHIHLSAASEHDKTVFKEDIAPHFFNICVYADRIYHDESAIEELKQQYNIQLIPCQKRKKNQHVLYPDQKLENTMVSQIRQPIESFFNWLIEHTGIQQGAKIRSTKGVFKHVYGKLTAALLLLILF